MAEGWGPEVVCLKCFLEQEGDGPDAKQEQATYLWSVS